jgi:hypothetical protein
MEVTVDGSQATLTTVALFALRCLIPLALTLTMAYLMDRQVRRWGVESRRNSAEAACWELRNCAPERRKACAAFKYQGQPCWSARLEQDECLPEACVTCPLFNGVQPAI